MNIYEASKKALQEKKCMRENPTARVICQARHGKASDWDGKG